jgi:hypothetical protein
VTALLLLISLVLPQQLPSAYAKEFENEWVRVTRVIYPANATLPSHAHNNLAAAYVYLNDAPPVIFRHHGVSYGAVTRPATKAGGVRLYKGIVEDHEVVNTGGTPSEFLRVEFKTDPKSEKPLMGRFFSIVTPRTDNLVQVQFENDQVRMSRIVVAPAKSVELSATGQPSLLVALMSGTTSWIGATANQRLTNNGAEPTEWLRFEFKTAPLK